MFSLTVRADSALFAQCMEVFLNACRVYEIVGSLFRFNTGGKVELLELGQHKVNGPIRTQGSERYTE